MELQFTDNQARKNRIRFGGQVMAVYSRDKFACVDCGMTMTEHTTKYGKRLSINHIDGSGRRKVHKYGTPENHQVVNNTLENLETLCLRCHGLKDGLRTTANQHGKF